MSDQATKTKTCTWTGASGKDYTYHIFPIGTSFKAEAGNYIFAAETNPGRWRPIYIGETSDLSERFDDHHKMPCIRRNGATHVHAKLTPGGKQVRLAEEADLVAHYAPTCNG